MRKVDCDVSAFLSGGFKEPFRNFLEMDTLVLDKAMNLYADIPENTGHVSSVLSSGGTSGNFVRRYFKKGMGRCLSGCRTVVVRLEKDGATHEWTEYIVFD